MNWLSLQDFLAMGGYGFYVWGSFGMVFAAMALECWALGRREKLARASLPGRDNGGAP